MTQRTTALARVYRPQTLTELLGQEHIVNTLNAAIEQKKIAQAYILSGIRGVGKTTVARILARSLNCENGPTTTPCGTCGHCTSMDTQSSLDTIEIDAASNNGVEHIRDLIGSVAYAPTKPGRKKIYILDEAHMLSTSAWNALLKTLEEPPEHVMFIFATTEMNKIPATVRSRCQTLVLKRVSDQVISKNLVRITKIEQRDIEDKAANLIARVSEGSMRDALSILDQTLSAHAGPITIEHVSQTIGRASRLSVAKLTATILQGKTNEALTGWDNLIQDGHDSVLLLKDVLEWMQNALLAQSAGAHFDASPLPQGEKTFIKKLAAGSNSKALLGATTLIMDSLFGLSQMDDPDMMTKGVILRLVIGFENQKGKP